MSDYLDAIQAYEDIGNTLLDCTTCSCGNGEGGCTIGGCSDLMSEEREITALYLTRGSE